MRLGKTVSHFFFFAKAINNLPLEAASLLGFISVEGNTQMDKLNKISNQFCFPIKYNFDKFYNQICHNKLNSNLFLSDFVKSRKNSQHLKYSFY